MNDGYIHLEWDTLFFGYKVAKLFRSDLTTKELQDLLRRLELSDYHLIYWETLPDDFNAMEAAEQNKGALVDIKTTFCTILNPQNQYENPSEILNYNAPVIHPDLIDLAWESGKYSRFRKDPNIRVEQFKELYKLWIEKSVERSFADEVFVYSTGDGYKGLVTVRKGVNTTNIGLIAVNLETRGQKIGKKLLDKVKWHTIQLGFQVVEVVTQRENERGCNFYIQNGFNISKEVAFYHFWL
jgi:dTDP-4-amino-4,6-dideoxy-D-galactose acyltransferase